jgi:hypothetical protein
MVLQGEHVGEFPEDYIIISRIHPISNSVPVCRMIGTGSEVDDYAKLFVASPLMLEALIDCYVVMRANYMSTDIVRMAIESATGMSVDDVIKEAGDED